MKPRNRADGRIIDYKNGTIQYPDGSGLRTFEQIEERKNLLCQIQLIEEGHYPCTPEKLAAMKLQYLTFFS